MTDAFVLPYWSIFETRMVNREDVLGKIQEALEDDSQTTHIFYITGGGGYGKTKLLRTVLEQLAMPGHAGKPWVSKNILTPKEPVDLYHISTRSEEGLAQQIALHLDPDFGNHFKNFEKYRNDFARKKYQIQGSYSDIQGQRKRLMTAFLSDYEKLYARYDRIVLALDTAEIWRLLEDADRFQQAQNEEYHKPGSYEWAIKHLFLNIRQSVVLIAGRPNPDDPENDILLRDLRALEKSRTDLKFHHEPLQPFSMKDSLAYFEAMQAISEKNRLKVAERLAGIDREMRETIHYLTGGEPLLLAMSIDYLAQNRSIDDLYLMDALDAQDETRTPEQRLQVRAQVQKTLIEGIQAGHRPLDQVIEPLSWLRKGMNAEMLAWIEKGDEPDPEEVAQAEAKIQNLLDEKNRLTFIKVRPGDNRLFMHDELYDLYDRIHASYSPLVRNRIYSRLEKYYEHVVKLKRTEIARQKTELLQKVLEELEDHNRVKISTSVDLELMETQASMEALLVEHVYYTFLWNPNEGFRRYMLYSEEAFQSLDEEFWIELMDELKKFRHVQNEWGAGPSEAEIEGEIGIGWIRYYIMTNAYEKALNGAEQFVKTCEDLFSDNPLLLSRIHIWMGRAMVHLAKSKNSMREAEKLLMNTAVALEKVEAFKDAFEEWLVRTTKAEAHINLGYLYRTWGRFSEAILPYRRALAEYRYLKNEAGQANTLNNLAWAEAEDGKFELALIHCNDGLKLRRKATTPSLYTVALSLNTRGLIKTRLDNATDAEVDNKLALLIFKGLEEQRGIGLAKTALSEAIRRSVTESDLDTTGKVRRRLLKAAGHAEQAVRIFEKKLKEPLRTVEAQLELGCVYRELARFTADDPSKRNAWFEMGRSVLEKAVETAHDKFEYRAYDALVNLAFLYYYASQPDQAKEVFLNEVYSKIDSPYLFRPKRGIPRLKEHISWYWVQLGKGYSLMGRIAFDSYEKAKADKNLEIAQGCLDEAVEDWFLSLEYNARYGRSFRDMTRSKIRIYDGITTLNTAEQQRVLKTAMAINEKYRIKINREHESPVFIQLLEDAFGMTTGWSHTPYMYTQE